MSDRLTIAMPGNHVWVTEYWGPGTDGAVLRGSVFATREAARLENYLLKDLDRSLGTKRRVRKYARVEEGRG